MPKTMIAVLGIDLGKNSCSLAGLDQNGAVVLRRRATREGVLKLIATLPPLRGGNGGVLRRPLHGTRGGWARARGPADAGGVRQALREGAKDRRARRGGDRRGRDAPDDRASGPIPRRDVDEVDRRFVALKSEVPLDLQAVHRVPQRRVAARTRLINQLRAMLLERGVILPKRRTTLRRRLETLQAPDLPLGERSRHLLDDLREAWGELDRRIAAYDDELTELARMDERAKRLTGIPGIGPGIGVVNATALVAAVGDGATFTKARDLAAPRRAAARRPSRARIDSFAVDGSGLRPVSTQPAAGPGCSA